MSLASEVNCKVKSTNFPSMKKFFCFLCFLLLAIACGKQDEKSATEAPAKAKEPRQAAVEIEILGTAQDAGSPQMNCIKSCCAPLWGHPEMYTPVVSLGVTDFNHQKQFLFEATPDVKDQWQQLSKSLSARLSQPSGIFLTHAHMGHYSGLLHFGREAMGAKNVPVYGLPRLTEFLNSQGPWEQLVHLQNIELRTLVADSSYSVSPSLAVKAMTVPHRDEYSETAAFLIEGPDKSALFVPDIDKWALWEKDLNELLLTVDYAFIDATFFDGDELPGRNMDEIPHPFVVETLEKVKSLPLAERQKIYLIHFNHTNPLLHPERENNRDKIHQVNSAGLRIARVGQRFSL